MTEQERIDVAAQELRDAVSEVRMRYMRALHQAELDHLAHTTAMPEGELRAAAVHFVERVLMRTNELSASALAASKQTRQ